MEVIQRYLISDKMLEDYIRDANALIGFLRAKPSEKRTHSDLANHINWGRHNIDALSDLQTTGQELLRKHEKDSYSEKIAMILRDINILQVELARYP